MGIPSLLVHWLAILYGKCADISNYKDFLLLAGWYNGLNTRFPSWIPGRAKFQDLKNRTCDLSSLLVGFNGCVQGETSHVMLPLICCRGPWRRVRGEGRVQPTRDTSREYKAS